MAKEIVTSELSEQFDFKSPNILLERPNKHEVTVIQQVVIAGLCENVARIAPVFDALGNEIVATSKTKVSYESQESKEKLHIPKVSVIAKVKPSFLVYSDIYQLGGDDEVNIVKHYMKNCTVVK